MKARPILFSGPMVRALLEGRKTQTRRDIKAPTTQGDFVVSWNDGIPEYNFGPDDYKEKDGSPQWRHCPYGQPGDLLYVREGFEQVHPLQVAEGRYSQEGQAGIPGPPGITYRVIYRADGEYPGIHHNGGKGWPYRELCTEKCSHGEGEQGYVGWGPSMFMPRWASRLTLQVKSVRVERLNDIGQGDACAEGAPAPHEPIGWYSELWESINGKGSWAANPWVWVVEFEVHKFNVDDVIGQIASACT